MFMISYVVLDELFNYYPIVKFSNTREKAEQVEEDVREELERQTSRMEELFEGKIVSEPYFQEIDFKILVEDN
ncbi:MAG: hypothetical protein EPN82_12905 [Bacteroidetes bacterium]|nr:MAG: hypothetical protein EPN82_12905 [Bacteroidota bacterium]